MAYPSKKTFTVTKEHLKILRKANVTWNDCEAGAASIDCKYPYGEYNVALSIAKIIGLRDGDFQDELPEKLEEKLLKLHEDTEIVLQIVLTTGKFKAGKYRLVEGETWKLVSP